MGVEKLNKLSKVQLTKKDRSLKVYIYFSIGLTIFVLSLSFYNLCKKDTFDFNFLIAIALIISIYVSYKNRQLIKREIEKRKKV